METNHSAMWDAKAVAAYLGVCRKTVYRAVKSGRIETLGFRVIRLKRVLRFEKMETKGKIANLWEALEYRLSLG